MKTTNPPGRGHRRAACLALLLGLTGMLATAWGAEAKSDKEIHVFIEEQVLVALKESILKKSGLGKDGAGKQ